MEEVKEAVIKFTKDRDWDQFHSPANLAKSIVIESGELLECFQWDENFDKQKVCEELADVINYAILLADKLNVKIEDIVMAKLKENSKKYPIDKSKGNSKKYTELQNEQQRNPLDQTKNLRRT
jgi:NTP pyrophosphatase (non-canonical NTP hydrolase)